MILLFYKISKFSQIYGWSASSLTVHKGASDDLTAALAAALQGHGCEHFPHYCDAILLIHVRVNKAPVQLSEIISVSV